MSDEIYPTNKVSLGNYTYHFARSDLKFLGVLAALAMMTTASAASANCLTGNTAKCAATINSSGLVGQTSYTILPFVSSVYQLSWGSSPSLSPANLFWQSGTNFTNATTMANAKIASTALTTQGVVPASGSQRWED